MSADPTLEFLTSELSSEDPSKCVECISRLQVVALSLGAEKTVSLLIPYLAAQTENFSDEVLVTVAEVLPFLVDMVGDCEPAGTPGGKAAILNLLGDLCHQEETTVRDQAVASLNKIGATLSAKDVQTLVVPIALKLARTLEWFTPRVSACGLFALSFKAVADDASAAALRGELRETFKALGIDDAPMVRRSTAGRLAEFAEVLSESMVIEDLLPLYFTLCTDEQDSVRVNALKCTAALCKKVRPQDKIEILDAASKQGVFGKAVSDKSWRVRVACAEGFADVADACKGDGESVMVHIETLYKVLQGDHEQEVRVATALKAAGVAAAVKSLPYMKETIFPALSKMAKNTEGGQRIELAGVLMDMAKPLGKDAAIELVFPDVDILLVDEKVDVRLAVINRLGAFIETVGMGPSEKERIEKISTDLAVDKNWRIRHSAMLLLPKLAAELGQTEFDKLVSTTDGPHPVGFLRCPYDGFALIRTDWAHVCAAIGERFGAEWLEEKVMPVLDDIAAQVARNESNTGSKAAPASGSATSVSELSLVLCAALSAFADQLPRKLPTLLTAACKLADNPVPNVKIELMKCAGLLLSTKILTGQMINDLVKPAVEKCTGDDDMDVAHFAAVATERMQGALLG
jgi:serine/threonine-protein phosphatase 2A regulatory subunit A